MASIFFNRELSWLKFNERVLDQARSHAYPLLERLKYLAYVSSNLDEFFEIRIAGLIEQLKAGKNEKSVDGLTVAEQLELIRTRVAQLVNDQYACWREEIIPTLRSNNIFFKNNKDLSEPERIWLEDYFDKKIFPVLTPIAIVPDQTFLQVLNKGLNLLVEVVRTDAGSDNKTSSIAVIPVPRVLPRVVSLPSEDPTKIAYIFLSDVLKAYAWKLFPNQTVKGSWEFRITRNSDLYFNEEEVENLLEKIEEKLDNLQKGIAVRLEICNEVPTTFLNILLEAHNLKKEDAYLIEGPLNLMRLLSVYEVTDRKDLKFPPYTPHVPEIFKDGADLFSIIRSRDIFLHHPYDSFAPVENFIEQAAKDPQVLAIKQTVYRTNDESSIIETLKNAALNGKQVTVLVELKARFDEARNIALARQLEDAGASVIYGFARIKTHCKCCLVIRKEGEELKQYVHLSTGNYNPKTARAYTDISFFTVNEQITNDVVQLFNTITSHSTRPQFTKLLVSPFNYFEAIQAKIEIEIQNAQLGRPARIIAKMNGLSDPAIIETLYKASQAGVRIDLVVRGICCLVPGVKGLSDTITVRSILGKYLEHSRFFYFENAGDPDLLIGSADWMTRNFARRIEAVFPVENIELKNNLINYLIEPYLKDEAHAVTLTAEGVYLPSVNPNGFSCQDYFESNHSFQ